MKPSSPKTTFSIARIVCGTLGHDYMTTRQITSHINEYKCAQCGKEVTNTYAGHLEILTQKTKAANNALASFVEKKMRRKLTPSYEKAIV